MSPKLKTVRAVHPNAGVQAWYADKLDAIITAMAAEVERHILAAYTIGDAEYALDARSENPAIRIRKALTKWGTRWTKKFDDMSADLANQFARKNFSVTQTQIKSAFKDAGFTVKFQPTPGSVAAYHAVAAEQVNLIRSIPAQYLKDVQSKVWVSVLKGGDQHTLATQLRQTYGVTKKRAALIARDQNNKAKATIEQTRRAELGVTHAIWVHSSGGKVPRATHIAMDGKPYKIAVGMYDSNESEYVLPGQLINCRCTSKAVIPAFDTIKSVREKTQSLRNNELFNAAARRAR